MAKQNPTSSDRSKVRIFFVEGDFAPGDLHELTQTLANAIRPASFVVRPALPTRSNATAGIAAPNDNSSGNAEPAEVDPQTLSDISDEESPTVTRPAKDPAKPRNYRKPQPVNMDMAAGGTPFKDFAGQKTPSSHRGKYLVAATWLHDFAKLDTITADHVFTCYKAAGWNFDVSDPTVTLRQLKGEGLGTMKHGSFSINHLGLAEVVTMKASA